MLRLDHAGIVVADLDAAVAWYCEHFECRLVWSEAATDVDDVAIGLPGERVRLRGAILQTGDAFLELHEYLAPTGRTSRRVCDLGIGHVAFFSDDIVGDYERLRASGMRFYAAPRLIEKGGLAGHWWAYGEDPWGNVVQLCHHPDPPEEFLHTFANAISEEKK